MKIINFMDPTVSKRYDITWWLRLSAVLFVLTIAIIVFLHMKIRREFITLQTEKKHYATVHDQLAELEKELRLAQDNAHQEKEIERLREENTQYHQIVARVLSFLQSTVREKQATVKAVTIDQRHVEFLVQANKIALIYSFVQMFDALFPACKLAISHLKRVDEQVIATVRGAVLTK